MLANVFKKLVLFKDLILFEKLLLSVIVVWFR